MHCGHLPNGCHAYNGSMSRIFIPLAVAALIAAPALALGQTTADPADIPGDSFGQRVERIEIQDSGNRIDELRVGGQTRSIRVEPKSGTPAYDVQPGNPRQSLDSANGNSGPRTWKILHF